MSLENQLPTIGIGLTSPKFAVPECINTHKHAKARNNDVIPLLHNQLLIDCVSKDCHSFLLRIVNHKNNSIALEPRRQLQASS